MHSRNVLAALCFVSALIIHIPFLFAAPVNVTSVPTLTFSSKTPKLPRGVSRYIVPVASAPPSSPDTTACGSTQSPHGQHGGNLLDPNALTNALLDLVDEATPSSIAGGSNIHHGAANILGTLSHVRGASHPQRRTLRENSNRLARRDDVLRNYANLSPGLVHGHHIAAPPPPPSPQSPATGAVAHNAQSTLNPNALHNALLSLNQADEHDTLVGGGLGGGGHSSTMPTLTHNPGPTSIPIVRTSRTRSSGGASPSA